MMLIWFLFTTLSFWNCDRIQAEEALAAKEVPVGCVFVKDGLAIAKARNRTNEWRNVSSVLISRCRVFLRKQLSLSKGDAPRRARIPRPNSENAPVAAA